MKNPTQQRSPERKGVMWKVLETARKVTQKSRIVEIDRHALFRFSSKLMEKEIEAPHWDRHYHFFDDGATTVAYILVLDTLNFCFWPPPGGEKWEIRYQSRDLSGYFALAAAIKKALLSGIPVTHPEYLSLLSTRQLREILGGKGQLQLLHERSRALNELGRILIREYDGKAHRLVEAANGSALRLASLLAEKLLSFRDVAGYSGEEVLFFKRAQIFTADLYCAFGGRSWGYFTDISELTAFADYKLPQVLRHLGILRYGRGLEQKVDQMILIHAGSPEEIEIRANTIWAVELIRQELERMGRVINACEIDWILWNLGQEQPFRQKPYHRTLTIFY